MFLIQKLVNNLFKNNHIIILWNVLQVMGENDECLRRMMWLAEIREFCCHQSNRACFKGRAYINIILKNHARSYYRGNTVANVAIATGHAILRDPRSSVIYYIIHKIFSVLEVSILLVLP